VELTKVQGQPRACCRAKRSVTVLADTGEELTDGCEAQLPERLSINRQIPNSLLVPT
jgi:hypothetical protein